MRAKFGDKSSSMQLDTGEPEHKCEIPEILDKVGHRALPASGLPTW